MAPPLLLLTEYGGHTIAQLHGSSSQRTTKRNNVQLNGLEANGQHYLWMIKHECDPFNKQKTMKMFLSFDKNITFFIGTFL